MVLCMYVIFGKKKMLWCAYMLLSRTYSNNMCVFDYRGLNMVIATFKLILSWWRWPRVLSLGINCHIFLDQTFLKLLDCIYSQNILFYDCSYLLGWIIQTNWWRCNLSWAIISVYWYDQALGLARPGAWHWLLICNNDESPNAVSVIASLRGCTV